MASTGNWQALQQVPQQADWLDRLFLPTFLFDGYDQQVVDQQVVTSAPRCHPQHVAPQSHEDVGEILKADPFMASLLSENSGSNEIMHAWDLFEEAQDEIIARSLSSSTVATHEYPNKFSIAEYVPPPPPTPFSATDEKKATQKKGRGLFPNLEEELHLTVSKSSSKKCELPMPTIDSLPNPEDVYEEQIRSGSPMRLARCPPCRIRKVGACGGKGATNKCYRLLGVWESRKEALAAPGRKVMRKQKIRSRDHWRMLSALNKTTEPKRGKKSE